MHSTTQHICHIDLLFRHSRHVQSSIIYKVYTVGNQQHAKITPLIVL